ncbi:MAG: hypothetical protein ACYTFQ_08925, partial [Planctomycetota bacterium]
MKSRSVLFNCLCPFVLSLIMPTMVRGSLYVTDYRYGSPAPGYDASASPIIEYWFDVQVSNNFTDA